MLPVMETGNRMSRASRWDYLQRVYSRYRKASRAEKQGILDEFCANCSYHRKHAIRLLNRPLPAAKPAPRRRVRGRTYGPPMMAVLKAVWEAADYPWSVRLKALLPEWMPWIRRRFRLTLETERQLLRISPRSIDYRLRGEKRKWRRRLYGRTKPGTLLKHHIPLKTDHWDVQVPGFTEIDLVSHSGNSAAGDFCYSLNLTDIHTGWTETQAVLGKSQEAVRGALETIRQGLALCLARHRFGPWLGVHQPAPLPLLPGAGHAIHARAALPERRQRAHRAEELDARAALAGLCALRHRGGAGGDQRSVSQRVAAVSESLSALGETGAQGAGGLAPAAALRSASNASAALAGLRGGRPGAGGGTAAAACQARSVSALGEHRSEAEGDLRSQPRGPRALEGAT